MESGSAESPRERSGALGSHLQVDFDPGDDSTGTAFSECQSTPVETFDRASITVPDVPSEVG